MFEFKRAIKFFTDVMSLQLHYRVKLQNILAPNRTENMKLLSGYCIRCVSVFIYFGYI